MTSKLAAQVRRFVRNESGAVTIDWVVLTAGVAFLALFVVATIVPVNNGVANRIAAGIELVKAAPD